MTYTCVLSIQASCWVMLLYRFEAGKPVAGWTVKQLQAAAYAACDAQLIHLGECPDTNASHDDLGLQVGSLVHLWTMPCTCVVAYAQAYCSGLAARQTLCVVGMYSEPALRLKHLAAGCCLSLASNQPTGRSAAAFLASWVHCQGLVTYFCCLQARLHADMLYCRCLLYCYWTHSQPFYPDWHAMVCVIRAAAKGPVAADELLAAAAGNATADEANDAGIKNTYSIGIKDKEVRWTAVANASLGRRPTTGTDWPAQSFRDDI